MTSKLGLGERTRRVLLAGIKGDRNRFIARWGILYVGLPLVLVSALQDELMDNQHLFEPAWLSLVVRLTLYVLLGAPFVGILWGLLMWHLLLSPGGRPHEEEGE